MKKCNKQIDTSVLEIQRKEISVDGVKLPLAIGDTIAMNDEDRLIKTVMGIQINEDCRINYCLEWFDGSDNGFKSEWVTLSELKLLQKNAPKKKVVVLNG